MICLGFGVWGLGFGVWGLGLLIFIEPCCRSVEMMAVSVFPVYTMSFFRFVFKGRRVLGFLCLVFCFGFCVCVFTFIIPFSSSLMPRWSPGDAAMLLMVAVASGVTGAAMRPILVKILPRRTLLLASMCIGPNT